MKVKYSRTGANAVRGMLEMRVELIAQRLLPLLLLLTGALASAPADVQARIAHVESGLLPRYVIDGRPVLKMTLVERMAFYKVPGVGIAVLHNGVIEWAKGYGVREAGQPAPVGTDTLFQAASISKPVAAMAALRLVQEGKLSLDEDVNRKLTTWKVPENEFTTEQKVTLRRMLTHSAGLTVHGFPGYAQGAPLPTLVQVLDGVPPANTAPIRVNVKPGALNRYSGGGFTLIQQMLIDVTGKPFPDFMQETVLGPLGMRRSTCQQPLPEALWRQAASAHDRSGVAIKGRWNTYPEMAAAGLWTTPSDLARFAIELRNAFHGRSERVLSAATARQMLTRQRKDLNGLGIGLGGEGKTLSFSHGGANRGFMCYLVAFAESGDGAAIMTNGDRGQALIQEVLRGLSAEYGWPEFRQEKKTAVVADPKVLQSCAGTYQLDPGNSVLISFESGKLYWQFRPDGPKTELFPESATTFFSMADVPAFTFEKDGKDNVVAVRLGTARAAKIK